MKREIPRANKMLASNPIFFSENISRLLYHPTVHVRRQLGCCANWSHGYLEIGDFLDSALLPVVSEAALSRRESQNGADLVFTQYDHDGTENNTGCRLDHMGDTSLSTPIMRDTERECVLSDYGFAYIVRRIAGGKLNVTLSEYEDCNLCSICGIEVSINVCYVWNVSGSKPQSFSVTNNAITAWDASEHMLHGPIGILPAPNSRTGTTITAFMTVVELQAWCTGEMMTTAVMSLTFNVTDGSCETMDSPTPYSLSVSSDNVATLGYECTDNCSQCNVTVLSPLDNPRCTVVQSTGTNLTQAWMLMRPVDIAHNLTLPVPSTPPSHGNHPRWHTVALACGILGGAIAALLFGCACWRRRSAVCTESLFECQALRWSLSTCRQCGTALSRKTRHFTAAFTAGLQALVRSGTGLCESCFVGLGRTIRAWSVAGGARISRWCMAARRWLFLTVSVFTDTLTATSARFETFAQPETVILSLAGFLTFLTTVTASMCAVWSESDPFSHFSNEIFERVGLSGSSLSANEVVSNFESWSSAAFVGCWILCAVGLISLIALLRGNTLKWLSPALAVAAIVFYGGLLLPPFTFFFYKGFHLTTSANSTFLHSDPSLVESVEYGIGIAFSTVAFSWYSTVFTFATGGICLGSFVAAVFFSLLDHGLKASEADLWSDLASLQSGRIIVLVWLAHLMAPLVQLISVVILYQVSAQGPWFLVLWLALWGLPMMYVTWFSTVLRGVCHVDGTVPPRQRKAILRILGVYVFTFLVTNGVLLGCISSITKTLSDLIFFALLLLTSAAIVGTLSFVSLNTEYEADRRTLRTSAESLATDQTDSCAAAVDPTTSINIAAEDESSVADRTSARQCARCGDSLPVGGQFCTVCGHPVSRAPQLGDERRGRLAREVQVDPHLVIMAKETWAFLTEKDQQANPRVYGKRLPYRRLFLILSAIFLGTYLFKNWEAHEQETPQQSVQGFVDSFDPSLIWPQNETALNNLLDLFKEARDVSDTVCLLGWGFLVASIFAESLLIPQRGLMVAQIMSGIAVGLLFIGITIPTFPNYVADIHIHDIVPRCAPEFDVFVEHAIRNAVGLVCSSYFAAALFVVMLAISPAVIRVTRMMAIDDKLHDWKADLTDPVHLHIFKRNVIIVFAWGSLLAPFLCCVPMLIFMQFFGDLTTGVLFVAFALFPIAAAFAANESNLTLSYGLYLGFYCVPLAVLVGLEANKHHLSHVVIHALQDPMTYVEFLAEITLANVAVSDVIYASLG
eukprot:m.328194 g.328194  ORF g.328194 m.328194 type:complete len:1253 (-) comp27687_c0_seq3:421-4179(-)